MELDQLEIVVNREDAENMRRFLRPWATQGATVAERRWWLLWRRFEVTAPDHVIAALQPAVGAWEDRRWKERNGF